MVHGDTKLKYFFVHIDFKNCGAGLPKHSAKQGCQIISTKQGCQIFAEPCPVRSARSVFSSSCKRSGNRCWCREPLREVILDSVGIGSRVWRIAPQGQKIVKFFSDKWRFRESCNEHKRHQSLWLAVPRK